MKNAKQTVLVPSKWQLQWPSSKILYPRLTYLLTPQKGRYDLPPPALTFTGGPSPDLSKVSLTCRTQSSPS